MIRIALLLFPLLEIAAFIAVGREIGIVPTLGLVLLGVVAGSLLIRSVGLSVFREARGEMDAARDPGPHILRGFLHVVAGVLFIVPGFVSDLAALVLLLPPVHRRAWALIRDRVRVARKADRTTARPTVIELERTDYAGRPNAASPWAKEPGGGA